MPLYTKYNNFVWRPFLAILDFYNGACFEFRVIIIMLHNAGEYITLDVHVCNRQIAHDRTHSSISSDLLAVSTHQTTKVICLLTSSHSPPLRTALYIASAIPGNFPPDSFAPALAYTTCRVDMRELIPATRKFRSKFWSLSLAERSSTSEVSGPMFLRYWWKALHFSPSASNLNGWIICFRSLNIDTYS